MQKGWVTERAYCTLDGQFEALAQVIKTDIEEVNSLPSERRNGCLFVLKRREDEVSPFWVTRTEGNETNAVYFHKVSGENVIRVENTLLKRSLEEEFKITHRWDAENGCCELTVGNTPQTLEEISRRALSPLFFPHLAPHS